MNLFEAIFVRKSVRNYIHDSLAPQILEDILKQFGEIKGLFGGIETELAIFDNTKGDYKMLGLLGVKAPYYHMLYSEEKDRAMMNAGYLMEQLSLYLETRGIGSCFVGMAKHRDKELEAKGFVQKIILAFGMPKDLNKFRDKEPKRIALDELCVYKEPPKAWVKEMLEAARLAPSSTNSQPWRFVVYENRIHVFSKKPLGERSLLNPFTELNFGIMLANVMVAAEEVWIDLDLIKLNNITHKSIPNNQYVISILLKI